MQRVSIRQKFADFAKEKRIAMGMSQEEFAELIFGDKNRQDYISRVERGKKNVSPDTMDAILEAVGADVEFTE